MDFKIDDEKLLNLELVSTISYVITNEAKIYSKINIGELAKEYYLRELITQIAENIENRLTIFVHDEVSDIAGQKKYEWRMYAYNK